MIADNLKAMALPCLLALPFILLARWLTVRKTGTVDRKKEVCLVVFWLYMAALLSQTVIPERFLHFDFSVNPYHWPTRENTVIFRESPIGWILWMITLRNFAEIVRNIGGNILLFVPYGFLFPCCFRKVRRYTVLFGLLLSLLIEFLQLFFDRVTDVNDVLLNLSGIVTGYLLYLLYQWMKKKKAVS